jgi:hypothetical protein
MIIGGLFHVSYLLIVIGYRLLHVCGGIRLVAGLLSMQVKRLISLVLSFHEVASQGFFSSNFDIFLQTQVLKNGVKTKKL